MTIPHSLYGCVDLSRYPLHDLDSTEGRTLIETCHENLSATGALALDGFIPAQETKRLVCDERLHKPLSDRMTGMFCPYSDDLSEEDDLRLPRDHPRRLKLPASHRFIAGDRIPLGSSLQQIYRDQGFIDFLGLVLGVEALYPISDTLGCINILIYEPGDANGWHFDTTEFVISIMLQAATRGGQYQYIPEMRSEKDENLGAIADRMLNPDMEHGIRQITLEPGTLFLFKGKNTLHRVTRVEQGAKRVVAILSYHRAPGHILSEGSKLAMYGRTS
jgi:hypothetical protein